MNRDSRLSSARSWLATQQGRTPVQIARAYRKHFGLDWECAIKELALLGVQLEQDWTDKLRSSLEGQIQARARRKAERQGLAQQSYAEDSDDQFAFIAGYTAGGFPYGITWEEARQIEAEEKAQTSAPRILAAMPSEQPASHDRWLNDSQRGTE